MQLDKDKGLDDLLPLGHDGRLLLGLLDRGYLPLGLDGQLLLGLQDLGDRLDGQLLLGLQDLGDLLLGRSWAHIVAMRSAEEDRRQGELLHGLGERRGELLHGLDGRRGPAAA